MKMIAGLIFSCFGVLLVSTPIVGFGSGVPPSVCGTMTPGHGKNSQSGLSPYKITLNSSKVRLDGTLEITLESESGNNEFIGFLVQVRKDGTDNQAYGKFIAQDDSQTLNCFEIKSNAISHKDPSPKNKVVIQWIPESSSVEVGEYRVHTTFVKDKDTYWTNQVHQGTIQVLPKSDTDDSSGSSNFFTSMSYNIVAFAILFSLFFE